MSARLLCAAAIASLVLLAVPAAAQLACPSNPPLRIELGPYRTAGFALTSEQFDAWLANVRTTCTWGAAETWLAPVADAATLALTPGDPGECRAVQDTGARCCWSGDLDDWTCGTSTTAADEVSIADAGGYYTGTEVEAALQELGPLKTTPPAHAHAAADTTSGAFADARISATSVTQHESALEAVLDLADLQGELPLSTKTSGNYVSSATTGGGLSLTGTEGASLGMRTDCASGEVQAWDGDSWECTASGGGGTPGGADTQVQYNDGGAFGGDAGLTYAEATDVLSVVGAVRGGDGSQSAPMYSFASATGKGFLLRSGNPEIVHTAADLYVQLRGSGSKFLLVNEGSGLFPGFVASPGNVTVAPDALFDMDLGMGRAGSDHGTLVAGDSTVLAFRRASSLNTVSINGALDLNSETGGSKPTCTSSVRGTFWYTQGADGVEDSLEVCAKDSGDLYAWRPITIGF